MMFKKIIYIKISLAVIFAISLITITIKYDFLHHYNFHKLELYNFNIQGIECIDDKAIVLENASSIYEFKNDSLVKVADLKRFDEDVYNNINIVAHPTSIVVDENNNAYVTNSMEKRSPRIVKFSYDTFLDIGYLSTKSVKKIHVMEEYSSLHIESYKNNGKKFIILGGNTNNGSVLDFYTFDLDQKICRIDYSSNIQNLLWDQKSNKLLIFSNVVGYKGGVIFEYNLNLSETCPKLEDVKKIIMLTTMELEGYTYCNSKNIYAYVYNDDSYIYYKD